MDELKAAWAAGFTDIGRTVKEHWGSLLAMWIAIGLMYVSLPIVSDIVGGKYVLL